MEKAGFAALHPFFDVLSVPAKIVKGKLNFF